MQTTGTLFMSKTRPTVNTGTDGSFRLELALVDNMGRNPATGRDEKEAYRVHWIGPEAKAFWEAHQGDLTAGAPLHAELERLRAHPGPQTYPPMPELRGRVVRLQLLPRRAPAPQPNTEAATA
ncbi:hypothetical protein [Acidovorax temperans]|uniref:hypothetical protein n=1 Tax=Acidovorax temperans TaxID=80878 RepID=UPI0028A0C295|nr:hypothetical protein [Acidovorax temperans]